MAPMMQVTRREVDRPGGFREVRRNLHTAEYEAGGSTFTAVFDDAEGRLTGAAGEVHLPLVYSVPGLRRGLEGTAYGDVLTVRRPRYGWAKASRAIEVGVGGRPFATVVTVGLATYGVRDSEGGVLADVRRGRLQVREGLAERDLALCLALYESNLATTSLVRAFVPGSGPIASLRSRGSR